jgi:hypothetical protein
MAAKTPPIPPLFKADSATLALSAGKDGKVNVNHQGWDAGKVVLETSNGAEPMTPSNRSPDGRYAAYVASATFMTGRSLPTGGAGDSFASTMSVRLTRSYSAQTVSSQ